MPDELKDLKTAPFPQPKKILRELTPESLLSEWVDVKHRLDEYSYLEDSNDLRENYEQFMDDKEKFLEIFRELIVDITEAMDYYSSMVEYTKSLRKIAAQYERNTQIFNDNMLERGIDPLNPMAQVQDYEKLIQNKVKELQRRKVNLDKTEEEIAITQDILAQKKSEMELALQSRYTLTEKQKTALLDEKDRILDGIEKWGSVSGAISHDKTITSKAATILMYCQKFPEFGAAIEVSKQLFKDRLDGIMVERALEGTENPQFARGEYIGDYKVKDNKLLMELVKSKIPEQYNKKSVETVKNTQVNNMNIISFANVDETEQGYTKNVGVVLDVDDTGKVKRIQQEQKMIEYYSNKPGAEIITPEGE